MSTLPIHPTASHAEPATVAPAFVRVGETAISEAEIAREMQHHRAMRPEQSRAEAARALVVRELLRREVQRRGAAAEPVDRETAEEAAIRVLLEQDLQPSAPTAVDCQRYFEQNAPRLRGPDRIKTRHILLAAAPDDVDSRLAAREQAETCIETLKQHPERFTEFAMRFSACPSKDQGGDLGWLSRGQTTPEFDRQLFMLKVGLAGLSVESRYGHHVVVIDAFERGEPLTLEQAMPRISSYLELQRQQNAIHDFLQQLSEHYGVVGLDAIEQAAAA